MNYTETEKFQISLGYAIAKCSSETTATEFLNALNSMQKELSCPTPNEKDAAFITKKVDPTNIRV